MAGFSDKITVVIDVVTDRAKAGLASFKQSVAEAEGFTGKLRAGVGSLASQFGAAATSPAGLAAGVGAAATVAAKAVTDFADLGVEVGKFSDATGLSTEDASRWIEVAGDLGIEAGALQTTIGRLNKNVDPKAFADLGIEIARTADGSVNANQTFLNTIDALHRMQDPTERAAASAKLFGRGWQDVAEIIGMSTSEVRKRLNEVSDAKVFTTEEVARAREFRDVMQTLKDKGEDLTITLGQKLAGGAKDGGGALTDLLDIAKGAIDFFDPVYFQGTPTAIKKIGDAFSDATPPAKDLAAGMNEVSKEARDEADAASRAAVALHALSREARDEAAAHYEAAAATAAHAKELTERGAFLDAAQALADLKKTIDDESMSWIDVQQATIDASGAVAEYLDALGNIPTSEKTVILAQLDAGNYNFVLGKIMELARQRDIIFRPKLIVGGEKDDYANAAQQAAEQFISSFNEHASVAASKPAKGKNPAKEIAKKTAEDLAREMDDLNATKFEFGGLSEEAYRAYLNKRLAALKEYSDDWVRIKREIAALDDADAKRQQELADAEKKRQDEAAKAAADAAAAKARENSIAELQQALNIGTVIVQTSGDTPRRWLDELAWRVTS